MNADETLAKWEERFDDGERDIANMDAFDFMTLLMECRIIEAP